MPTTFSPEIAQFVKEELDSGQFADENALLTAALEVYREVKQRHGELRARVQKSIAQAERDEVAPLDMDTV